MTRLPELEATNMGSAPNLCFTKQRTEGMSILEHL